jgi:hypothetical protein
MSPSPVTRYPSPEGETGIGVVPSTGQRRETGNGERETLPVQTRLEG